MVTLYNVIDVRTNNFHPVAIVKEQNARWFIPVVTEEPAQEPAPTPESEVVVEPEPEAEPEPAPKKTTRSKKST